VLRWAGTSRPVPSASKGGRIPTSESHAVTIMNNCCMSDVGTRNVGGGARGGQPAARGRRGRGPSTRPGGQGRAGSLESRAAVRRARLFETVYDHVRRSFAGRTGAPHAIVCRWGLSWGRWARVHSGLGILGPTPRTRAPLGPCVFPRRVFRAGWVVPQWTGGGFAPSPVGARRDVLTS